MALVVLRTCRLVKGGLPFSMTIHMCFNIFISFAIGLIPLVGDMLVVLYQANMQNATILENYIREKGVSEESGREISPQWWQV